MTDTLQGAAAAVPAPCAVASSPGSSPPGCRTWATTSAPSATTSPCRTTYDAIYCIVDYHALTSTHDAELIRRNTHEMALGLLALGLDPERAVLFRQSDRPEHVELMWLFASVTPTGWVERTPSFKEKRRNQPDDVNLALLSYPVLQAADIAIYKASYVPVGKDQAAHLELAREIVRAFNGRYGAGLPGAAGRVLRGARREGHRRRQQDVEVARQRHRDLRARGGHPPAGHEHGHGHAARPPQRPWPPRGLQRLPAPPHLQPGRLRGASGTASARARTGCVDTKRLLADRLLATFGEARERYAGAEGPARATSRRSSRPARRRWRRRPQPRLPNATSAWAWHRAESRHHARRSASGGLGAALSAG